MADPELDAIRAKRMAELQAQMVIKWFISNVNSYWILLNSFVWQQMMEFLLIGVSFYKVSSIFVLRC